MYELAMVVNFLPFVILTVGTISYVLVRNRWLANERETDFLKIAIFTAFATSAVILLALLLLFSGKTPEVLGKLGGAYMLIYALSVFPVFLMSVYDCIVRRKQKY